jgi:ATP-binding cassette subfamily B protein
MTEPELSTLEKREQKVPKKLSALRGLIPFLHPYRLWMVAAAFALILTATLSLILPLAVRRVIDNFALAEATLLDQYFAAALGIAALLAIGTALRYLLVTRLGERVIADIRKAIFDRVISMSPVFYETLMTGEVLSRITTDTTLVLQVIGSSVSIALRNSLLFIGGILLMLVTSAKLTGLVLLIVPVVLIPIITLGRKLRRLSKLNQEWIAESSAKAAEALNAVQTVQAFTHEPFTKSGFADVTEKSYATARKRIGARALLTVIVIFFVFSGIVVVLWVGAHDVRAGELSSGTLVQFVIYAVLVGGSVATLSEVWGELQLAAGATERLVELLQVEDNLMDPSTPETLPSFVTGHIKFDNVSFRYPARQENLALDNVSFEVLPGQTIALVGASGAGKTTIIQMLFRFYDPDGGSVSIEGVDLSKLGRRDFRSSIALVPQDPVIFATSVMENIRFGLPSATDQDVVSAAKAAAADTFICNLPDQYESYVGERGVMLSGGQKQRIAIARAILRNAPVLLLDEATSALDSENEQAVQNAFDTLSKDRTTIIIAHRLATVKKADLILVMDEGKIIARDTHENLITQGGLYARLARLQFTGDAESI